MPLSMVKKGEANIIKKIGGKEDTKKFLGNIGFVVGAAVTVISEIKGNMIVEVKNSRVAIGKDMANKIIDRRDKYDKFKRYSVWKYCKS